MALDFKIKRALRGLNYDRRFWLPVWMAPLDHAGLQDLFGEPIDLEELYAEAIEQWENCPQTDLVDKTMQFYTKLYLQDDILVKADRASMMHSLEARAPFLDIELVDFVRRIPSSYKFRKGTTKYILKKSLEAVLPREILYRPKKGFGVPVAHWFRRGELDLAEAPLGSLNPQLVKRRVEAHRSGRADESAFLWSIYVLKKWAETNRVCL
jgi:asparagine synthase (glutamine-hydrolysing)